MLRRAPTQVPARAQLGVTLVEVMLAVAIGSILMMVALPAFTTFLQNARIKNAAETTLQGINLARAEAVRRNALVRFQFVSDLTSGCALSTTSLAWVVSVSDPTAACDATPGAATAPQIVQVKSAAEGTENVTMTTTGGSTLVFNGLGRATSAGITQIVFRNPTGGACVHEDSTNGKMRCMQLNVSTSGAPRICDPKVTDTTDPRSCS